MNHASSESTAVADTAADDYGIHRMIIEAPWSAGQKAGDNGQQEVILEIKGSARSARLTEAVIGWHRSDDTR